MTDLWKDDPEAFIILRLQESSDPDAAHKAFQAHLKEDAERDRALHAKSRESDALAAELAGLREERDKLHALYNRAQDDASREAEIRVNQGFEIDRLREQRDSLQDKLWEMQTENARLLNARREV